MTAFFVKEFIKRIDTDLLNQRLSRLFHPESPQELLHVNLDVTGGCNLDCRMCSLKAWASYSARRLSLEQIQRLNNIFTRIHSLDLQCNCEPLLHPEIVEIISHIKTVNPQLFVAFVTNGTLLTPELSRRLIESGLDKIGFSIDGACAETYERIRQGARFKQVLSQIRTFFEIRREVHSNLPKVEFVSVASRDNLTEIPQILSLGIEIGIDVYSVNGLEPYTEDMATQVLYEKQPANQAQEVFRELRRLAAQHDIQLLLPQLIPQPYTRCDLHSCVIDVDGDVYPCPALSYQRPYYADGAQWTHPQISFGNAFEQNVLDIWNSKPYIQFRKKLRTGHLPPYCQQCLMQQKVLCPSFSEIEC